MSKYTHKVKGVESSAVVEWSLKDECGSIHLVARREGGTEQTVVIVGRDGVLIPCSVCEDVGVQLDGDRCIRIHGVNA